MDLDVGGLHPPVDDALLHRSAREYGVLWTPMAHFYDDGATADALRLSVSAATPEQIDLGPDRLAALIDELRTARSAGAFVSPGAGP